MSAENGDIDHSFDQSAKIDLEGVNPLKQKTNNQRSVNDGYSSDIKNRSVLRKKGEFEKTEPTESILSQFTTIDKAKSIRIRKENKLRIIKGNKVINVTFNNFTNESSLTNNIISMPLHKLNKTKVKLKLAKESALCGLNNDIVGIVCNHLEKHDILNMMMTCKTWYIQMCRNKIMKKFTDWKYHNDFYDENEFCFHERVIQDFIEKNSCEHGISFNDVCLICDEDFDYESNN